MEKDRSAFKILTGKPTGKKLLRMPRPRSKKDVTRSLKEMCVHARKWIDLSHYKNYRRTLWHVTLASRVARGGII